MKLLITLLLCLSPLLHPSSHLQASSQELNITMVLWRGETDAERGFKDGLEARGFRVRYQYLDALQQRTHLAELLRGNHQLLQKSDYIYSFGTTATQMVKLVNNNRIPHIFNIVFDPLRSDIIDDLHRRQSQISGISHAFPIETQLRKALEVRAIKRIAFLFNPREHNSELARLEFLEATKRLGIDVIELRCPPQSDRLVHHLNRLLLGELEVDAVYLPFDSYLQSNAALIGKALQQTQLMSIGAQSGYIKAGVLMGLVPNYYDLGRVAASLVERHLTGQKMGDIPVYKAQTSRLLINETTLGRLKLSLPVSSFENAVRIR